MLALTIGSLLHVASDSLICGLIQHTCSQIEILEYRLNSIANDGTGSIEKCIRHHNQIYRDFGNRRLAYRAWLPYDYSSLPLFYMTYTHQMMALIIGSLLHVASDSLICGLILHTCSQIEILEYRLNVIASDGTGSLKNCIRHHNQIYWLAGKINDDFRIMLFTQFVVSTFTICFTLYQLTTISPYESRFLEFCLYMTCMMTQIFFYCWYGNKLKVQSLRIPDAIFETNWPTLDKRTKMVFLMIMRRATVPIEFTSGHVVALNLNSFVALLKTSYSAYNLLQRKNVA
ncbi:hypothetical protein KM043_008807 [Ampulex compressa]|nr:hypothetical protein KM043_008807 [Ampulex compressa]